jgi:hypothetical protein
MKWEEGGEICIKKNCTSRSLVSIEGELDIEACGTPL